MFNNVVLDVFIGLVLIYLLYSLFITIVSEMIVTWMNLRSRILRVAIEKMLNDGIDNPANKDKSYKPGDRIKNIIQRFFLKEFADFKHSFAGKFYASPSIKYLSDNGGEHKTPFTQTKPSYISADMFATTLIQLLKDKGVGETDIEKINFCLHFNTHNLDPATLKNLLDHLENAGTDISILKERFHGWFNETMDRATGWYKKKLQLILFILGFIVATIFNVDSIKIAKFLSKDKEARNQLANMAVAFSKDSARYADFVDPKGDTIHSSTILDSGYSHITKDISDANMILGLGWPLSDLTTDDSKTFYEKEDSSSVKVLSQYQHIVNDFEDAFNRVRDSILLGKVKIDKLNQQLLKYKQDTAIFRLQQLIATAGSPQASVGHDSITEAAIIATANKLEIANTVLSLDSAKLGILIRAKKEAVAQVNGFTSGKFVLIDSISIDTAWVSRSSYNVSLTVHARRPYTTLGKIWYVFTHYFPLITPGFYRFVFSLQFLGLFITALMLSLGAPFWFDLLKRLVAIRGAGIKPEEKRPEQDTQKPASDLPVNEKELNEPATAQDEPIVDVYDEALKKYGPDIQQIPGVKSVFIFTKNKTRQVQANVDTTVTQTAVLQKFPNLPVGTVLVPLLVVVSGTPSSHAGLKGIIANGSGLNGTGTLGCILKTKERGDTHILSCWHVLKGDLNYSESDMERVILDHQTGRELADRWAGGIRDKFDYGLASCRPGIDYRDNSFLKEKLGINTNVKLISRSVTMKDIHDQIPVKYYDNLTNDAKEDKIATGLIFANSGEVTINYIDKTRKIKDVLLLTNEDEEPISVGGNSGSIVFDNSNRAIAMIIGGDEKYTYAVKLSNIFSVHKEMVIA